MFEYIGSRRPVLAVASEGDVADLIRRTNAGIVVDRGDVPAMVEALGNWLAEHRRTGRVAFPGRDTEVEKLSRRDRTRLLASVFDEAAGH